MQVESRDGTTERRILIATIVSTEFLTRIAGKLPKEPFRSYWSSLVYSWCKDYYTKYREAPGRMIESLFETWARSTSDKETRELVDKRLLSGLSDEYARSDGGINVNAILELAERYFNDVMVEKLQETLKTSMEKGASQTALSEIGKFRQLNLRTTPSINIMEDARAQKEALDSKQRVLIRYPGPAGEFYGDELAEDSFVGVMAPPKGMKSFTLFDMAWRGMLQGRQVAYFQVGDLSQNQIIRRFHSRAVYRPLKAKTIQIPQSIILPVGQRELAVVDCVEKPYEKDISWEQAERAYQRLCEKTGGRIRLFYHPIKTVSIIDIRNTIEALAREGQKSQVVIIDYMENLAPADVKANPIEQVSYSWAIGRQISEVNKCLVVSASQSNKEGFKSWVLTRSHFRNSLMILAHVTAFIGVSCTDEEKSRGIIRQNFAVRREDEFSETRCLYMASCLSIANPCVVSCLPD